MLICAIDETMKYEDFTLEDLEILYEYLKGTKCFVCDGDSKTIIEEEQ